jgi:hypothetical protein
MGIVPWAAEEAPERQAALEKDPVVGARKRFQPEAKLRTPRGAPPEMAHWRIRDVLPDLARTYGVHFIADAYENSATGYTVIQSLPTDPVPLFELLDQNAATSHRWQHRGNLVRLRGRAWFLDRPREIPLRLVRRWQAMLERDGFLSFETALEIISQLTDLQLPALSGLARELPAADPQALSPIYELRYPLRLYASLNPGLRQALWRGTAIPVARLLPHQRELFRLTLRQKNRWRTPPMDLERWLLGSFSLSAERAVRTVRRQGTGYGISMQPIRTPAGKPGAAAPPPPAGETRSLVDHLQFRLDYGAERPEILRLVVATPP